MNFLLRKSNFLLKLLRINLNYGNLVSSILSNIFPYFLLGIILSFVGCGSGGKAIQAPANWTIVNGSVSAFGFSNGVKGALLKTAQTDAQGGFSISLKPNSGIVLVGVSGGEYVDMTTKDTLTLKTPLWSFAISPLCESTTVINPLTDALVIIAAEMPGGFNEVNIASATNIVKSKLGFNPLSTLPADPTNASSANGSAAAKAYGAYLGAFTQYLKDNPNKSFVDAANSFANALSSNGLFSAPVISKSIDNFLASATNKTGLNQASDLKNLSINLGALPQAVSTPPSVSISGVTSVIQTENAIAATQRVDGNWQVGITSLNHEIEGYASATSINRGESIDLFVNTTDPTYTISIYRLGWYGGVGGRLLAGPISQLGMVQPVCPMDAVTGMIECNWSTSYTVSAPNNTSDPTDWASGFYYVLLKGSSGKTNVISFILRDDARISDYLFQASVTTWQAYNNWGGKSHYGANSINGVPAYKISFNRPYSNIPYWSYEIDMIRFLEKEGYDVSYSTNIDTHLAGEKLLAHKAFLSVGHDEYWTKEMRDNIEAARDSGVNLGFFGSNAGYWQLRLEPSSAPKSQPNRTMAAYAGYTSVLDPIYGVHPELSTLLFRSTQIHRPEAALIGVMLDYSPVNLDMVINDCSGFICTGTGLTAGAVLPKMLGYEVDRLDASSPAGIQILASSPYFACFDPPDCTKGQTRYSSAIYYQAASGAGVFATGTMQWNWGLGTLVNHAVYANPSVQQMTRNVLNHFVGK